MDRSMIKQIQAAISILFLAGMFWMGYTKFFAPVKEKEPGPAAIAEEQRYKEWAYVDRQKEIAPGEIIKKIIVPGGRGLDTKCLVYTNKELNQAAMQCFDIDLD